MALVLPALRLWLLLLNIYGTFKAMKPPPKSQRNARNKSGPSARAMQLRKRELKSCLAVWVVWSTFSTLENVLDSTIGLVTPFYNELKCLVLLFLLAARAHGAEAIFLHLIHPLLRPYVPAIDDILAHLHSVLDLFLLLFILPLEYVSSWWHHWSWGNGKEVDGEEPPNDRDAGGIGEVLPEGRRILRPRSASQQLKLMEADREARVVFQDIDDAQGRVRARTRMQLADFAARNDGLKLPSRGNMGVGTDPTAVGLRTRRRVLEYPHAEGHAHGPGSRMTQVHLNHTTMDDLVPVLSSHPFPVLPTVPATQPVALSSNPLPLPPQPPTNPSSHEIWHPPRSALGGSAYEPKRTPSPIYPPLPSAYIFTPRASESLPPPPQIINPPNLVSPMPRRVSTGTAPLQNEVDDKPDHTHRARPFRGARSAEPPSSMEQGRSQGQDFFGGALESSIQAEEMDMDTETLSTRDSSSATEEDITAGGEKRIARATGREKRGLRKQRGADSEARKGKRKVMARAEPLQRSTRRRRGGSSGVETDEFGFTIRPSSSSLGSIATASTSAITGSSATAPAKKKPLARTKPSLKGSQGGDETPSSDEESERKKQRVNTPDDMISDNVAPEVHGTNDDQGEIELRSSPRGGRARGGIEKTGKPGDVRRTAGSQNRASKQPMEVYPGRTTRASTRQPASTKENQLHPMGAAKRMRGK